MRRREAIEKQQKFKKHYTGRHSRFGGTYYVMNMKSISDRDIIAHKHISNIESISFDDSKKSRKISKNRAPLKDVDITRRSTLAIRLFLQEFCVEFLNGAFNSLMYVVKDNLNRAKAQENDESYYLWAIKFFLEFNRNHNFRIELITETLNIQIFHYIQTQLQNYYDTMTTDKKKIPLWSRRMHKGLRAYQELLMTLSFMDKSENVDVRESSRILKNKVFYVVEYRELSLILLQNYDPQKMNKQYLKDLIETTHIFLKLLESVCGKQKHLMVQKKNKSKRKTKKVQSKTQTNSPPTEEELVMKWDEISDELLAVVKGESGELPSTIPYDPVSDTSEEDQKELAMKKINSLLRKNEWKEAVSYLRSSRDIWPEGDIFGAFNLDPVEELLCLRIIFMASINQEPLEQPSAENIIEEEMEDSDEEEEAMERISEQEFDMIGFVRRFAHTKVMQAYALMFRNFFKNSDVTNHCMLRLFHRLAWDCKLVPIFFQANIFRTFQLIMDKPVVVSQCHKDAIKFIKFVFRKFIQIAAENEKVFVEILFWKTNKDALEIECGYGVSSESSNSKQQVWAEEEEDELRRLYDEFKDADTENKDVVDYITENLINQNRTRRTVIRKLKEIRIINDVKELRKTVRVRAPQQWSEVEITELRHLVTEYIDSVEPLERILDHMSVKRPKKRVVDKILELGLVDDRKALRKKRSSKKSKKTGQDFLEANASSGEESDGSVANESEEDGEEDSDENISGEVSVDQRKEANNQMPSAPVPTPALIQASLSKVLEGGQKEAVEWIADLLQETADEREADGDFEPIPLVTITKACNDAMNDGDYLGFLKDIGIRPPQNHQEMFWRIPSNISIDGLRKRAQFLKQGLEGTEHETKKKAKTAKSKKNSLIEKENLSRRVEEVLAGSSDEEVPLSSLKGQDPNSDSDSSQSVLQNVENISKKKKSLKRKKSEKKSKSESSKRTFNPEEENKPVQKSKKRRIVEEEEENDEDSLRLHLDTEPTQQDDDSPKHEGLSRIYDSDDDASSPGKPAKRRAVFSSDDEGDSYGGATLKIIEDSEEE
ncbi:UNVERIFIED_CONTAM: hypothetical protein GTU68_039250 [Idotea baltica]|nr:hypothetical protein [Idotea baltica]